MGAGSSPAPEEADMATWMQILIGAAIVVIGLEFYTTFRVRRDMRILAKLNGENENER